jgi:hypothetical protein
MIISLVIPKDYDLFFPAIEDYLELASQYTYGRYSAKDIQDEMRTNEKQNLWIAYKDNEIYGFVVTEIIEYPQMTTLMMHFTAGKELPKWKDLMLNTLRRFAKESNCKIIESYGRKGWGKVFKNDGYKIKFIFYELPLEAV